jgi:segregation and condensation protein B
MSIVARRRTLLVALSSVEVVCFEDRTQGSEILMDVASDELPFDSRLDFHETADFGVFDPSMDLKVAKRRPSDEDEEEEDEEDEEDDDFDDDDDDDLDEDDDDDDEEDFGEESLNDDYDDDDLDDDDVYYDDDDVE